MFVDHPDRVVADKLDVAGIEVLSESSLDLLYEPEFRALIEPYLGQPVSMRRLNEMVREIIIYYRDHDQPVVDVSVPQQNITSGVVQIVVLEGRIGNVCVEGANYFDPCQLSNQVWANSGDTIFESVLNEELWWLNRNPFRSVDLTLTPGENFGETDLVFQVNDQRPWRAYVGYEDTGTRETGLERTIYGFHWGNAFHRDHQLAYQFTAASDFQKLTAHSLVYEMPLANRDILSFFGTYGEVDTVIDDIPLAGFGLQASIRYHRDLPALCNAEHHWVLGFDAKRTNTDLEFGGVQVFPATADVYQLMAKYAQERFDCHGTTFFSGELFFSPGGLSPGNSSATYQLYRAGATADYFYGRLYVQREQYLRQNLLLNVRATGQLADGNLIPSEQLGFGGYYSIRGYDMRLVNGDNGYIVNVELSSCPIATDWVRCVDDQLQFLGFYDLGEATLHSPLPGEGRSVQLSSVGVGLRYTAGRRVLLRADYGYPLDLDVLGVDPDGRLHIGAVLSY